MDNCTFTESHAKDYVIYNGSYFEDLAVYNSTFTNNDCAVFFGDVGEFTNCTFDKNGGSYTFGDGEYGPEKIVFTDCSFGNSTTFEKTKYIKFIDTDVENGAASIFGEGSLALIVASVALIASIASIIVNVTARKKKTDPVAKTESSEEDN